jgi:hypothetical protein
MEYGEPIPAHWLDEFSTARAWKKAVAARGGIIIDAPMETGHPIGTKLAWLAFEDASFGVLYVNGTGRLLKRRAGTH